MRPIVALFEESGNSLRPWAERGATCYAFDIVNDGRVERFASGGSITYVQADLDRPEWEARIVDLRPAMILAYPPCDDLAVSGARHFEAKRNRDPAFQLRAAGRAIRAARMAKTCGCPYFIENPVSVLATLWRKPDFTFHPYEYGGYLPDGDQHPRYPQYIAPRDAYPKKTCGWIGNGFVIPQKRPVQIPPGYSTQFYKLGGKSEKTKRIRSEGPRGFLYAVMLANWKKAIDV